MEEIGFPSLSKWKETESYQLQGTKTELLKRLILALPRYTLFASAHSSNEEI
jgi:hypothetical protein